MTWRTACGTMVLPLIHCTVIARSGNVPASCRLLRMDNCECLLRRTWLPEDWISTLLMSYRWEYQSMAIPTYIEQAGPPEPTGQARPGSSSTKKRPIAGPKLTISSLRPPPTERSPNTNPSKGGSTKSMRKLRSLIGLGETRRKRRNKSNSTTRWMRRCWEWR